MKLSNELKIVQISLKKQESTSLFAPEVPGSIERQRELMRVKRSEMEEHYRKLEDELNQNINKEKKKIKQQTVQIGVER